MARTTPNLHQNNLLLSFNSKTSLSPFSAHKTFYSKRFPGFLSFSDTSSSSSSLSLTPSCYGARIPTAPMEYLPPAPGFDFQKEITRLRRIRSRLSESKMLEDKLRVIDGDARVRQFFSYRKSGFYSLLASLNLGSYDLFLLKCVVAAGQEHVLASTLDLVEREVESKKSYLKSALHVLVDMIENWDANGIPESLGKKNIDVASKVEEIGALRKLLQTLADIEQFYDCIGGIIGYQVRVLELLQKAASGKGSQDINVECQFTKIYSPRGVDLYRDTEFASEAALWGIESLPNLGEIYPLGGSADRLGLVDCKTGECLPAAMLPYCGRTLLEGLIRDLQAREFLYFKIYGKQCITPVAIMTSSAKNNHQHIASLCERLGWFGRSRSSFQLFEQPLVPAASAEDGQWLVTKPFVLVCKPGGHGVIWKLAYDKGIFRWFFGRGRRGATVRQVSNVVAATDVTLLALAGIGLRHQKKLGFASCERNFGATEGINVLIEKNNLDGKWAYGLSCIEYTEFDRFGINDGHPSVASLQTDFPANTNILYVDLASAEKIGSSKNETSLPGMVLNTKKPIVYVDHFGIRHSVSGGRLECTMQSIADYFFSTHSSRSFEGIEDDLHTYIVFNKRRRVTSSAKRKRRHGDKSLHQTPDGSLLDIMRNAFDLLSCCNINIPEVEGNDKYIDSGPPFLILLHPALGPLWEVIRQKFRGGSISKGSELQIEAAEFLWRNVQLDGSMIIVAENIMGSVKIDENGEPILQYGYRCGRCKLRNIKVENKGIDWRARENIYWKHDVQRFETFKVKLHGNAEFEATDVFIQGNHLFEVPDGYKMKISSGNPGLAVQLDPIEEKMVDSGSWFWNYKIKGSHIQLELIEL